MKNEGFTLVELLAVLLILAFIALIAVPQILNLIEQSKIRSLKLSTESYIRAVNTSLINEEVFNNVKDGLYTIADDGKKIVLGDTEIYIASEGHGLRSGLLLIEDSKVKRVLKGMIDDYYARVTDDDIEILKNLNESTLVNGQTFNQRIKNLVGDKKDDGSDATYETVDTTVKKITFLQDSVLPEGYTKETLENLNHIDLSQNNDNSIKGYYDESNQAIYVYSDGYISFPIGINSIFQNFQKVEGIELNLIDTSNVTNIDSIFKSCKSLIKLDLKNFDTSRVTNMANMFKDCSSLTSIDISNFDTKNVTAMSGMFAECSNIEIIDLNNFDSSSLKNMSSWANGMFQNCTKLRSVKFGKKFKADKVTDMQCLFRDCSSLEYLDLSNFDTKDLTNIGGDYGTSMFNGCNSLKSIKFGKNFDTSRVKNMVMMFNDCNSLTELDLSMFDTSSVTSMGSMFQGCTKLKKIKGIENFRTGNVINMAAEWRAGMFGNCSSLTSLDLSNWDTNQVMKMTSMFQGCSSLEYLNLNKWDTRNVTDMNAMFNGCSSLKIIKFGKNCTFEKAGSMSLMFQNCSSLTSLDLSSFDTENVTNMENMFWNCNSLTELDLSNFNISLVASMSGMFQNCSSLASLDLSNWNTSQVLNMREMFGGCRSLTELDLTSFDTHQVTNAGNMFSGSVNFKTIKVTNGKWTFTESQVGLKDGVLQYV